MGQRHAILDDEGLAFAESHQGRTVWRVVPVEPGSVGHAGDVAALGLRYGRQQIWMVPGSSCSQGLCERFITEARPEWYIVPQEGLFPFLQVRRKKAGIEQEVLIAVPELDEEDRWPLSSMSDGRTLYATLQYLEQALGVPILAGPAKTGQDLLKRLHEGTPRGKAWLRPLPPADLAFFGKHQSSDLRWIRPLSEAEERAKWVHVFDKNGQYASATGSVVLGAGRYEQVEAPAFEKRRAGLWQVKLSGTSGYDGQDLPHPFANTPTISRAFASEGTTWQHTAQVALALEVGYQVEIERALLFAKSHRILAGWHDRIKAASDGLNDASWYRHEEARLAARECVKAIRNQSIGKFSSLPTPQTLYRPDWRGAIISEARACMIRNIATCAAAGVVPFACHVDSLYVVSEHQEVSHLPLRVRSEMGHYKHLGAFPLLELAPWLDGSLTSLLSGIKTLQEEAHHA